MGKKRQKTALVTGAGGFIGRHLVELLLERGWTVRALLLPGEDAKPLSEHGASVVIRRGDLTDPSSLEGIADGARLVFHLAARVTDWGTHEAFRRVTVDGTRNLLEACRGREIERFVYFSSFTALGFTRDTRALDEDAPCVITGIPYSDTKVEVEEILRREAGALGISWTVVRPSNVIGPGSVWAVDMLDALREGRMLLIEGGRMPTAFVHVRNLVEGALLAAEAEVALNRTYHFRDGFDITWGEYVRQLGSWIGAKPKGALSVGTAWSIGVATERLLTPFGRRPPVTRLAAAIIGRNHDVSVRRAREELGWTSSVTLEETMAELRQWTEDVYLPSKQDRRSSRSSTVFITGGSQGIGLAIAREYRRQGSSVAIFARSADRLEAAKADLLSIHAEGSSEGALVEAYRMDVADEAEVKAVVSRAMEELGAPDILVNCAGIIAADRLERIPSDRFEAVLRTNFFGAVHTVRALLPVLRQRRGRIVNIASVAGLVGMFGYTAYSGSKYGLIGFSECLRGELRSDGVSVTVVCPPEVPTEMVEEEEKTLPPAAKVLKRMAGIVSPETVARATVRGAAQRRFMVVPGGSAKFAVVAHMLSLGALSRLTSDVVLGLYEH